MKIIKFKSLSIRIWITYAVIILIIIFSSSFLYIHAFNDIEEDTKIEDLSFTHNILLIDNDFNESGLRLDEIKNIKGSKHIKIKIDNNNIYASNVEEDNDNYHEVTKDGMRAWMTDFINEEDLYKKQFKTSYEKDKVIFIISSIEGENSEKSYLISYIKYSKNHILVYIVIGIGVIFIILGFFIAKTVSNAISRPIKELESFTTKIANKNWNESIKINSEDEIGRLAVAMNKMQKTLKYVDEGEKVFLESISHDLKTPVMVIMSHAEAIVDGIYIESVENTAEIIKKEAITLEKKIKQLLYLNTLDYILKDSSKNVHIDLQNLIFNTISRFKLVNSKIIWEIETSKTFIYGNMEKIEVVLENILDNQLRYAKEKICISLKQKHTYAIIEIYNDGPKIDEKHINHIFNNMYKDKTGNFGIGLAICKKIIEFYRGEILAINKKIGVSFIIKLHCD